MNLSGHDIGVCSWSLNPASMTDLVAKMDELALDHVQLNLVPLIGRDEQTCQKEIDVLNSAEIAITAGMVHFEGENYSTIASIKVSGGLVPSEQWSVRKQRALDAGRIAQRFGIQSVSLHLGFIPPANDPSYTTLIQRTREIASVYGELGISLLFETGQERATELLMFLNDLNARNAGVNFDPANMILYGSGDPVEAVKILGRHIRHVHIKDAIASDSPGIEWGTEVPFGHGDIDHLNFIRALHDVEYDGPLVIERECGSNRLTDIRQAVQKLESILK
ncbi:MAG: hexulose-6-phosphate isomerase [Phycisphaerae bacterium]|jgi:sugar phosphate isomerase/epimerase|nr:MAG: hexulose-6-phosphate isomerase [Phycisphaerae bacterium]